MQEYKKLKKIKAKLNKKKTLEKIYTKDMFSEIKVLKGCVRYIFACLVCMSKREHS